MPEGYRLFVNDDNTVMVRIWASAGSTVGAGVGSYNLADTHIEVATREDPGGIWGPPVEVSEVQH